jgi:hypothetical protein
MEQDLYTRLGNDLRKLFEYVDPLQPDPLKRQMERILIEAGQIGGHVGKEAAELHRDVARFLENPQDEKKAQVLKRHALKLKRETREI